MIGLMVYNDLFIDSSSVYSLRTDLALSKSSTLFTVNSAGGRDLLWNTPYFPPDKSHHITSFKRCYHIDKDKAGLKEVPVYCRKALEEVTVHCRKALSMGLHLLISKGSRDKSDRKRCALGALQASSISGGFFRFISWPVSCPLLCC